MQTITAAIALVMLMAGVISAHGVGYRQSALPSVPLEFFYSTGEEMSYREARVFSPIDEKFAVQSGRTDEHGRFAFVPDVPGVWRVIVRDEEGHQANAEIEISQEFLEGSNENKIKAVNQREAVPIGGELFIRSLLGISIIFNIAMSVLIFRRNKTEVQSAHQ